MSFEECLGDINFQLDGIHSWSDLPDVPECGRRGILVQDVPQSTTLRDFVEYFEDAGRKISFLSMMHDGVFLDFSSEEVASAILKETSCGCIKFNGHNLAIYQKVVPKFYTDCLVLQTSQRITITKYIKKDLEYSPMNVLDVQALTDHTFKVCFSKMDESVLEKTIQELNSIFSGNLYKFEKAWTDCLKMNSACALTEDLIKERLKIVANKITKIALIDEKSALIYLSDSTDLENICKTFQGDSADNWALNLHFHQSRKMRLLSEPKSKMDIQCETWKDQLKQALQENASSFCFTGVYNWFEEGVSSISPTSRGILVQPFGASASPDFIKSYFKSVLPEGNTVTNVVPLTDGLFLKLQSKKGIETVLGIKEHKVGGSRLDVYEKVVPAFFKNKLVMKNTPNKSDENIRMTLTNLSPEGTRPVTAQKFETNASLIEYDDESDVRDMNAIKTNADMYDDTRSLKISLLRKTDCLKVKKLEGEFIEDAKPILQSQIIKRGKITRFDIFSSDSALVYFSNYEDAENIFEKSTDHVIKGENSVFVVELYYHCFSRFHLKPKQDNSVDQYYRKWADDKFKTTEFYVPIRSIELYRFLRLKQRHVEKLCSTLDDKVTVELHEDESSFVLKPAISGIGKTSKLGEAFQSTCCDITTEFMEKYCSFNKSFSVDNLKIVRELKINPAVAEDYDGDDLCDITVEWTGDNKEKVVVTGVRNKVESFISSTTQLLDVKSHELSLEPAKYSCIPRGVFGYSRHFRNTDSLS